MVVPDPSHQCFGWPDHYAFDSECVAYILSVRESGCWLQLAKQGRCFGKKEQYYMKKTVIKYIARPRIIHFKVTEHRGIILMKSNFPFTAYIKILYTSTRYRSLYPLLRKAFTNPEDLGSPSYIEMIKQVDHIFHIPIILFMLPRHEHGLQLIKK